MSKPPRPSSEKASGMVGPGSGTSGGRLRRSMPRPTDRGQDADVRLEPLTVWPARD